ENVSWQSIFFLNLPVAALAVVVTLAAAPESRDETVERFVDVPGVVALSVGLAAVVLALVEGNSWGWGSAAVIGLLAVAAGALVAGSLLWQSFLDVDTSYSFLIGAFALMGLGMGFVMSPMSTAAMNAVEHTKAGVASGILSMSRMVGGTFGVAVLGALIAVLGRSRLADLLPNVGQAARDRMAESLGAGGATAGGRTAEALNEAFVYALQNGLRLG